MRHPDAENGFDVQEAILKANARTKKWITYSVVVGSFALFAIAGILIGLYLTGNLRQVLPDQDDSIHARTHGDALTGDFAQNQFGSKKLDGSVDPLAGGVPVKLPTTINPVLLLAAKKSDLVDKVADAVSDTADMVKDAAGDIADAVKDVVGDIVDSVDDAASDAVDNVGDAFDKVKDGLEGIVDAHNDAVEDTVGDAIDLVKDAIDTIADKTDDVFDDVLSDVDVDDIGDDMRDNVGLTVKDDESDEVKDIFDDVLDDTDDNSDEIIDDAGDKLKDTLKKISKVGENIKDGLEDAGENIKDGLEGVLDGVDDLVDDSRDDGIFEGIKTVIKGVGDSVGEVVDKTKDLVKNIGENLAPSKILDDGVRGTDDLGDGLGDDIEVGEFDDNSDILHDVLHDAVDDVDDSNDDTGEANMKTVGHGITGELHGTIIDVGDHVGNDDIHSNSTKTNLDKYDDDDSDENEDDTKATIVVGKTESLSKSIKGALEVSVNKDDGRNNDGIADILDDVLDDGRSSVDNSPVMHVFSEKLGVRVPGSESNIDTANDDQRDDTNGRDFSDDDDDDDIDDNSNRNTNGFVQANRNNEAIRRNNNNDDDSDDDNDDDNHNSNKTITINNADSQNDASDDGIIIGPSPAGILLGRSDDQHENPQSSVVHLNSGTFITVSRPRPAPVRTNRVFRLTVSRNAAPQPVLIGSSNNNGERLTLQSNPQSSVVFNNDDDDNDDTDDRRSPNINPVVPSPRIHSAATFSTSRQSVHPNFPTVFSQLSGLIGQPNPLLTAISTDPMSSFTTVSALPNPWRDQSDSNNWQGQIGFGGSGSDMGMFGQIGLDHGQD